MGRCGIACWRVWCGTRIRIAIPQAASRGWSPLASAFHVKRLTHLMSCFPRVCGRLASAKFSLGGTSDRVNRSRPWRATGRQALIGAVGEVAPCRCGAPHGPTPWPWFVIWPVSRETGRTPACGYPLYGSGVRE